MAGLHFLASLVLSCDYATKFPPTGCNWMWAPPSLAQITRLRTTLQLLSFCPSLLKINPETLEATWEMAEPQDQRHLWPWSLLGRKPTTDQVTTFQTLHASIMCEPYHVFGCVCYSSWCLKHLEVLGCLQNYGVLINYCKIMDLIIVCQVRHELTKKHTNNLKLRRLASTLGKPSDTSKA